MATLALGAAGAAIGSAFGAPQLGFAVGSLVGGFLDRPRAQQVGKLDDLRVSGSGYGQAISQVYGVARCAGTIIWSTDLVQHERGEGAKGGYPIEDFTYSCSFAVAVCRGPINSITKIWADDTVIYDPGGSVPPSVTMTRYLGDEFQTPDPFISGLEASGTVPGFRGIAYVVFQNMDLTAYGNRIPNFSFEVNAGATTLGAILTSLAEQAGLNSWDLQFAAATQAVTGYTFAERSDARTLMESLLTPYLTDLAEVDGKLVALPRGMSCVATISADDLGARVVSEMRDEGGSPPTRLTSKRGQEVDLPRRIDLGYFALARSYEQATQGAVRYTRFDAQSYQTVLTNCVFTDDEARQRAETLLYTAWIERDSFSFSLPLSYLYLVPGSPVLLPMTGGADYGATAAFNGAFSRVRITRMDIGLFGELVFEAVRDDSETGIMGQVVGGADISVSAPTVPAVVDTVFDAYSGTDFADQYALTPGFYVAATGGTGWQGCGVFYSGDGGTTWLSGPKMGGKCTFGLTTSTLASWSSPATIDSTNSVGVALNTGTLASVSLSAMEAGQNAALIGSEQLGFETASLVSGEDYTLSNFQRGRRSTSMSGHANGERFWLLDNNLRRVTVPQSWIGTTVLVKCVSPGQDFSTVAPVSVVIAQNTVPYAPAVTLTTETPSGTVDGSNKTFTLGTTPSGLLLLFRNDGFLAPGGVDYSLSGNTLTMTVAPQPGDILTAVYYHN